MAPDKTALRDAATIIVLRRDDVPSVLMGQRGAGAAFMPSKFVFPGGAVDPVDHRVPVKVPVAEATALAADSVLPPTALAAAAIRELWEETGQIIGAPGPWTDPPQGWRGYAATGHVPDAARLRYFFRAITPQGRPRRFDARFFLADAADLMTDPDDFGRAEDELSLLQWVPLAQARTFDLPFIAEVVLAELVAHVANPAAPLTVPFFRNDDEAHLVSRLNGARLI
ncbi:NUDIX domain-containing protein [Loktanella sp. DJP18]|uniref:NUDIX domain-containing protein n=1 Tax=Loktanella sp. DJP18 TaxID=3409788 RepID=UPI003BB7CC09